MRYINRLFTYLLTYLIVNVDAISQLFRAGLSLSIPCTSVFRLIVEYQQLLANVSYPGRSRLMSVDKFDTNAQRAPRRKSHLGTVDIL